MSQKIRFRRGAKAGLPNLAEGEPGWVTDEGKVYIGTGAGNIPMAREDHTHTAEQVGALPLSGGRVNGRLVIESPSTSGPHIVLVDPVWGREIKIKAEAVEGSGEHLDALTFSGTLLAGLCDPVNPNDAATKQYVDAAAARCLPKSGGTVTGDIELYPHKITAQELFLRYYDASHDNDGIQFSVIASNILALSSADGLANLEVNSVTVAPPTSAGNAANKQYVDSKTLVFADKAISAPAWSSNSSYSAQGYHWRAGVACAGVTADHRPDVAFDIADAVSGNFAPVADSYTGGVFIYCKTKPTTTVTVRSIVCIKGV